MKANLITANPSHFLAQFRFISSQNPVSFPKSTNSLRKFFPLTSKRHYFLVPICCLNPTKSHNSNELLNPVSENSLPEEELKTDFNIEVATANVPSYLPPAKLSLSDQAFFLLVFIACTVCFSLNLIVFHFYFSLWIGRLKVVNSMMGILVFLWIYLGCMWNICRFWFCC